jgi:hypothetical protein
LIKKLLIWLKTCRRHRCRDCGHFDENWLTSENGQLYRFGFCQLKVYDTVLVDGDVGRHCHAFRKKRDKKNFSVPAAPPAGHIPAPTPGDFTGMPLKRD